MVVKQTGENLIGKGQPGPGRPKGVPNKSTAAIKDMITQALDKAGGVDYLVRQANENPGPFLTLVGKVLPMQVTGDPDNPIAIMRVELVAPEMKQLPAPEIELVGHSTH
jgi:hypothetical protein